MTEDEKINMEQFIKENPREPGESWAHYRKRLERAGVKQIGHTSDQ